MKPLLLILLLSLSAAGADSLLPEDDPFLPPYPTALESLVTLDGKEYHDLVITNVGVLELSFRHATGSARIAFERLPRGVQNQYLYDPVKAEEYLQEIRHLINERKETADLERARRDEAASKRAAEIAAAEARSQSNNEPKQGLEGVWFRENSNGTSAFKIYCRGYVSVTVYDRRMQVVNQHFGRYDYAHGRSREDLKIATENWVKNLRHDLRFEIRFPNSNSFIQTNEQGGKEVWSRVK